MFLLWVDEENEQLICSVWAAIMLFINIYPYFFCFPFLQSLKCLKRIDLRGSAYLIRIPDFSNAENLCYLNLEECSCLEEISWSVEAKSESTTLDLSSCRLRRLLEIPYNIKELYLNKNTIEQLPEKIGSVKGLQRLDLEIKKASPLYRFFHWFEFWWKQSVDQLTRCLMKNR